MMEWASQNYVAAVSIWLRGASVGDVTCEALLAECYLKGKGVAMDRDAAFQWYLKAAAKGNNVSLFCLAVFSYQGDIVSKDHSEAYKWVMLAKKNGYVGDSEKMLLSLQQSMSTDQLEVAENRIREFLAESPRFPRYGTKLLTEHLEELRLKKNENA